MFEDFASVQTVLASIGCVGFWEADYSVGRIRTTGQLTALYGLTPSQGEQGASWSQIDHAFHPDDMDIIRRLRRYPATLSSGSQIVRFRMIDADGQIRHMEGHGSVIVDRDGMLTRTTGLVFETTNRSPLPSPGSPVMASLVSLDRLSANLLQVCREAKQLGLEDVEADLRPTLSKLVHRLGRKFRMRSLH